MYADGLGPAHAETRRPTNLETPTVCTVKMKHEDKNNMTIKELTLERERILEKQKKEEPRGKKGKK